MRILPFISTLALCAAGLTAQESYDKLVAAYQAAANEDPDAAVADFAPKFTAAAEKAAGTEDAVPLLTWIVQNGRVGTATKSALTTLATQHSASLHLGPVLDITPHIATYLGEKACMPLIDGVLAAGSPPELQARALLARATMTMTHAKVDDEARDAAAKDLAKASKLTKDTALLATIKQVDTGARGLAIGDTVLEVAGFDLDGQPFRLSDYRGKVVVLDFWGDW